METPVDELVAKLVDQLNAKRREEYDERAAIMEFEALLPRAHAECLALLDVLHRHPGALTGVVVVEARLQGATTRLLTTDLDVARKYLTDLGAREIEVVALRTVIEGQYGGIALLTAVS